MPTPRCLVLAALAASVAALSAQEVVRAVPPGREIQDTKLLTLGKTDRWDLEVAQGEVLWCKVESAAFDPVLSLVDSDGVVLATNDGEGTRSELLLRAPAAGPVSLQVRGYEGSGGGHYSFWLQRYEVQPIGLGDERSHEFGDSQWWHCAVSLEAGDILVPTVVGNGRLTAVLDLQQRRLGDTFGGYRIPRDGEYLLRMEGAEHQTCRLQCALARDADLPDAHRVDTVIPGYGLDVWRVAMRPGEAWLLELEMPAAQLEFALLEQPGPGKAGPPFVVSGRLDKGGVRRHWHVARRACNLQLTLRHRGAQPTPYRVHLAPVGDPLAAGTTLSKTLPIGGGAVFDLDTEPGQLLRLTLDSAAFDPRIEFWDPAGNVLHRADDRGPLDRTAEMTWLIERPGQHRILVCSNGGGGDYTLQAEALAIPTLELDAPLSLDLEPGETRYAHIHLAAGQHVWISARSAQVDASLSVLSPRGEPIGTWDGGGVGHNPLAAFEVTAGGRHTVRLDSRSGAGPCVLRALLP